MTAANNPAKPASRTATDSCANNVAANNPHRLRLHVLPPQPQHLRPPRPRHRSQHGEHVELRVPVTHEIEQDAELGRSRRT